MEQGRLTSTMLLFPFLTEEKFIQPEVCCYSSKHEGTKWSQDAVDGGLVLFIIQYDIREHLSLITASDDDLHVAIVGACVSK